MTSPRQDAGAAGANRPPCDRRTILLVEDDEVVRGLVEHVLERDGYEVLAAGDGDSGLALARAHAGRIDLLLTDVMMPRMSGRELANRLRGDRPGIPVLFMTGYADPSSTDLGELADGEALLHKPFRPGELTARVRQLLSS